MMYDVIIQGPLWCLGLLLLPVLPWASAATASVAAAVLVAILFYSKNQLQ